MDEKNLQPQDVLMQPVMWEGQEYYTSQYFHREYQANAGLQSKYQQHSHFSRLLRSIEAYDLYVEQGDIVELSWREYKLLKNNSYPTRGPVKILDAMFVATRYQPLTLINKTGQIALTHHLDDEFSKQMSVAANTMVARQDEHPIDELEILQRALAHIIDHRKQLADHDDRIKRLEASQGSGTGYATVLAYCRLRGLKRSLSDLQRMGKDATKRAHELGLKLGEVPDERWGKVKSYPIDFLDEFFAVEPGQSNLHLVREREAL